MAVEASTTDRRTWDVPDWLKGLLVMALIAGTVLVLVLGLRQTSSRLAMIPSALGRRHGLWRLWSLGPSYTPA